MRWYLAYYEDRDQTDTHPGGRCLPDVFGDDGVELLAGSRGWSQVALCATSGQVPRGTRAVYLGDGARMSDVQLEQRPRQAWESALRTPIEGETLNVALHNHLLQGSVLAPARHGTRLRSEVWVSGRRVESRPFTMQHNTRQVRELLATYQKAYGEFIDRGGDPDVADRWLDRLTAKHGKRCGDDDAAQQARKEQRDLWEKFIPPNKRSGHRGPIKSRTSWSDDFNRANESPPTGWKGYYQASPFTNADSNITVTSNEYKHGSAVTATCGIYQSALSDDDAETWCHRTNTGGNNAGPLSRTLATGTQGYYAFQYGAAIYLRKCDGTETTIGSHSSGSWTDWVKVYPNGSTIKAYNGGTAGSPSWTERVSGTNTTWATGLYSGIGQYGSVAHSLDGWNTDDLATGGGGVTHIHTMRGTRGMYGGVFRGVIG